MAKLKKVASAESKATEKKSSMKIRTASKKEDAELIQECAEYKAEIKDLETRIKAKTAQMEPLATKVKELGLSYMITDKSFDSIQLQADDAGLGIVVLDKYTKIEDAEVTENAVAALVGEDSVSDFLEYKQTVSSKALENEKVFEELVKFSDTIKEKFGVSVLEQVLQVKKDVKNKIIEHPEAEKLIKILKPQINLQLK